MKLLHGLNILKLRRKYVYENIRINQGLSSYHKLYIFNPIFLL